MERGSFPKGISGEDGGALYAPIRGRHPLPGSGGIPLDFTGVKSGTSCFPIVSALKGENSGPGCI